eukprot:TRINITY_DN2096_c0_g1_i2.p1 TRINITY_DN2096_c0_g1~~TRINITY_DN2096_c0_g1_i2.p1  ORF type:complete len:702 (+),score=147.26 TRINITY_DN2096_c0_g1_i2:181-2286(+)
MQRTLSRLHGVLESKSSVFGSFKSLSQKAEIKRSLVFTSFNAKNHNTHCTSPSLRLASKLHITSRNSFSTDRPTSTKKVSILDIKKKYKDKVPISMVTAYDYTSGMLVDSAEIDMILVGDSVGMVVLGYNGTTEVTMDDMIHHSKAVKRGAKSSFIVGDMPFGSYEVSAEEAVRNATRLVKEGGVEAIKMEGGRRIKKCVEAVVNAGIPVVGHIGLTPQTCSALGGFKVQGKTAEAARDLLADALELEAAGAFAIVIEGVPERLGSYITSRLSVPTIGIGAGKGTSGQVLVFHDMLGMYPHFVPKFCKQFANLSPTIQGALKDYKQEVEAGSFPAAQHTYSMKDEEFVRAFPEAVLMDALKTEAVRDKPATSQPSPAKDTATSQTSPAIPTTVSDASAKPLPNVNTQVPIAKNPEKKKTIAIIGGGAMGSLMGGRIAATGKYNVWMLSSWKDHVDKINTAGLKIVNLDRSVMEVNTISATMEPQEILQKHGGVDLALVLVKGPNTKNAAIHAATLLKPNGHVLTLQNGLGNKEIIASVVGEGRVIQGVTSQASLIEDSGKVRHTGIGNTTIAFYPHQNRLVSEVADMLNSSGIPTELTEATRLESMQWGKLIVNAGINPLTAIFRVKNGELVDSESCRTLLGKTVNEGVTVANAKGNSQNNRVLYADRSQESTFHLTTRLRASWPSRERPAKTGLRCSWTF